VKVWATPIVFGGTGVPNAVWIDPSVGATVATGKRKLRSNVQVLAGTNRANRPAPSKGEAPSLPISVRAVGRLGANASDHSQIISLETERWDAWCA